MSNPIQEMSNAARSLALVCSDNSVSKAQPETEKTCKFFFDCLQKIAKDRITFEVSSEDIAKLLGYVETINSKEIKKNLSPYLTILIHQVFIKTEAELLKFEKGTTKDHIKLYQEKFGRVPVFGKIHLPDNDFLPKNYLDSTQKSWASKPVDSPSRAASGDNRVEFFRPPEPPTITTHSVALNIIKFHSKLTKGSYSVSAASLQFHDIKDLQTDHVHPYADIVARAKLLILAINVDGVGHSQLILEGEKQGYLISINGEYKGTKKLYMELFNDSQNVWFLPQSENAGGGKGATHISDWIKDKWIFGEKFNEYMTTNNFYIDDSEITLRVRSRKNSDFVEGIGHFALKWLADNYDSLIEYRVQLLIEYKKALEIVQPNPETRDERIFRFVLGEYMLESMHGLVKTCETLIDNYNKGPLVRTSSENTGEFRYRVEKTIKRK